MRIAFYLDEMNYRGVANATYMYALNNIKILKNSSYIFYNKNNKSNKKEVLNKFKKKLTTIGVLNFSEVDKFQKKYRFDYLYVQKGGEKDYWVSKKIKTVVHSMYPQRLSQVHGFNYVYISDWLSKKFSNKKIPYVPIIVETFKSNRSFKKKFKIKNQNIVLGCHGGESSFDMNFVKDSILHTVNKRKELFFIFLNIKKFCTHPRIKFLNGTANELYKRKFINTCDFMIHGRSLGESFGLACAEFAVHGKPIISYKFNRHRSHVNDCPKKYLIEYDSYENLNKILINLRKFKKRKNELNKYFGYNAKKVMNLFKRKLLSKGKKINFSLIDHLSNLLGYFSLGYLYLRHKLYNNFYNFFRPK